jgi:hypothetical protein
MGEIGELALAQDLERDGVTVFQDWEKDVSGNGFDMLAVDVNKKEVWCIDNKAHGGTISEATSLTGTTFQENLAKAKDFLNRHRGFAGQEAEAAVDAISRFEKGEAGAVVKVVSNMRAAGNAGFGSAVFSAGIRAYDIRLGRLFADRAAWLEALRAGGFMSGARRFVSRDRLLPRQRGFATVGGMVFILVAVGSSLYAIRQAENKLDAVLGEIASWLITGLLFRATGLLVGTVVAGVATMYSDDPRLNEEHAREEAAIAFLKKFVPGAVTTHGWGITWDEPDPDKLREAYDFLFNTDPIVLSQAPSATPTAVPAPAPAYTPLLPPPPSTSTAP